MDAGRVEEELSRLESEGFLTARQVRAVNRAWIASFFQTELGRRLQTGIDVLREFKFSLLADGEMLQEELAGEKLLLQGVVDCCLTEGEGLTVLDFKTDRSPRGRGSGRSPLRRAGADIRPGLKPDFRKTGESAAAVFLSNRRSDSDSGRSRGGRRLTSGAPGFVRPKRPAFYA